MKMLNAFFSSQLDKMGMRMLLNENSPKSQKLSHAHDAIKMNSTDHDVTFNNKLRQIPRTCLYEHYQSCTASFVVTFRNFVFSVFLLVVLLLIRCSRAQSNYTRISFGPVLTDADMLFSVAVQY